MVSHRADVKKKFLKYVVKTRFTVALRHVCRQTVEDNRCVVYVIKLLPATTAAVCDTVLHLSLSLH